MPKVSSFTEENLIKCTKCEKYYSSEPNMKRHLKSAHIGLKFQCGTCTKQFDQKCNLDRHVKSIHERIRQNCDKCEKSFSDSSSLKKHKDSIHENIKFQCIKCEEYFPTYYQMKRHGCKTFEIEEKSIKAGNNGNIDVKKIVEQKPKRGMWIVKLRRINEIDIQKYS